MQDSSLDSEALNQIYIFSMISSRDISTIQVLWRLVVLVCDVYCLLNGAIVPSTEQVLVPPPANLLSIEKKEEG